MTTGHKLVVEFKEKYNVIDNGKKIWVKHNKPFLYMGRTSEDDVSDDKLRQLEDMKNTWEQLNIFKKK